MANGYFLLFLNSDVVVRPGAISRLASALESRPEAGVVGPQLSNPDGSLQPSIQRLPTPWRIFCESSGIAALWGGRGPFRGHTETHEDHATARQVEALLGAALLFQRPAFERTGGFDESFFFYADETDLLRRMRDLGYRILYEPSAVIEHRGGASSGESLRWQLHRSLRLYVAKHHGFTAGIAAAALLALGAAARYLIALVTPGRRRRERYRSALLGGQGSPPESESRSASSRTR